MKLRPGSEKKIETIHKAISAKYDTDKVQFTFAIAVVSRIENKISELRDSIVMPAAEQNICVVETSIARKHRSWVEAEIKKLNLEMARARVDLEDARAKLAQSSAKFEVVKRLKK